MVLIFALALMPLLISLVVLRRIKRRWQARLRRIDTMSSYRSQLHSLPSLSEEISELHDYFIGDLSCRYNARSPYVRCAVNPDGPCEGCIHYQQKYRTAGDRNPKRRS
nr:DUF6464 family protein [Oscillatoria sp. FACHB-1406]